MVVVSTENSLGAASTIDRRRGYVSEPSLSANPRDTAASHVASPALAIRHETLLIFILECGPEAGKTISSPRRDAASDSSRNCHDLQRPEGGARPARTAGVRQATMGKRQRSLS